MAGTRTERAAGIASAFMSTYVLIHGSWHGAWCWEKVVALLEERRHRVVAPDLPGHGQDETPPSEVTLRSCADSVCAVLDSLEEPAILVGHSTGGHVITQAAEYAPERIETLVYLCAYLVPDGQSPRDILHGTETLIYPNMVLGDDGTTATIRDEVIKEAFYGDCSDEDVTRAKSLLTPEPLAPGGTPVSTTEGNFGRIPRVYIECLSDRAIPPHVQRKMYTALLCQKLISMDTSHSPFLSAPEELVEHLVSL